MLTLAAIAKDRGGRKQMLREYLQAVWCDQAWTPPATEAQQPWMTLAGLAFPIEFANNLLLLLALFLFND
jgi:hypothetical protein